LVEDCSTQPSRNSTRAGTPCDLAACIATMASVQNATPSLVRIMNSTSGES
jgi:hypothetical protein